MYFILNSLNVSVCCCYDLPLILPEKLSHQRNRN
jgi:hypothetical protein